MKKEGVHEKQFEGRNCLKGVACTVCRFKTWLGKKEGDSRSEQDFLGTKNTALPRVSELLGT